MNAPSPRRALAGLLASASLAALLASAQDATFSLADDFSYTENRTNSTWSYRLDDFDNEPPGFPLLNSTNRDANALWGSDFPTPPMMWSEAAGYWGIGKNVTGRELFSAKNGTRWAPGEVLFHPKGGASPSRLVVGWTAPSNMVIDAHYAFGRGTEHGNGIGYDIIKRVGGADTEVVVLDNIGASLTNRLTGMVVAKADQLFFRFHTCGNPGGDISRAAIQIHGLPWAMGRAMAAQPAGGVIAAGSDFTFSVPATGAGTFQWRKDGQPIPGATSANHRISDVKLSDAGTYSVVIDSVPSVDAMLTVTPKSPLPERFQSPTPRQAFSQSLAGQEQELKTNVLMLRFAESRKRLAADPYRPAYHFVSPESMMNDPNGPCFWQGRWHLFYQVFPPDAFPDPKDRQSRLLQAHWGHAITDDWVHWRDLPYAIYPGIERVSASGGTVVEEMRVIAFYPGHEAGQMVAIAKDPLLLNWEKLRGRPVNAPASGDSCIWKEGDAYFGLIGCRTLLTSQNLVDWQVLNGSFLGGGSFPIDDGNCPTFLPVGDKHILLLFSHSRGGQYLLGDYDRTKHQFIPYEHGRFDHGTVAPGGVHAPSGVGDGKGGVISILNINDGRHTEDWDQLLSLPQHLTLGPDKRLRIEPVAAVASLRGSRRQVGETVLPANKEIVLEEVKGNAMEVEAEIDPKESRWVQLNVLRSPQAEEQTSLTFFNYDRKLAFWYHTSGVVGLDGSRSSILPDVWVRTPEMVAMERGGEPLKLRIFVDHSVVEVFVNGKQYLAMRVYPGRKDSVGVSVRAQGQDAVLKRLDAWQMQAIWPTSD